MNVLFASSELYPLVKTGGLADVSAHLPAALHTKGADIRIVIPGYNSVLTHIKQQKCINTLSIAGYKVRILETSLPDTPNRIWVVDCPPLYARDGGPYQNPNGQDWPDNAQRFFLFCKAIAMLASSKTAPGWKPDIVHCNDWQTGLVPALLSREPDAPPVLFTIHNLAYQGLFPYSTFLALELPPHFWNYSALEFYGQMSFIKGGLVYAQRINTVSPRYAREIKTPQFGCGLDGLLRHRSKYLSGILNGIDPHEWDPQQDKSLSTPYGPEDLALKADNKKAVQSLFDLPTITDSLLIGVVSRLTQQKGIDLIVEALAELVKLPVQIAILGTGDKDLESMLTQAANEYRTQLAVKRVYDEAWAHLLIGGSDAFLMPSRFEPCGLTQMYSLRYGTVPIVTAVGGLADTVTDSNSKSLENRSATGILIKKPDSAALVKAIKKCLDLWKQHSSWHQLQLNGMQQNFSWEQSAEQYMSLYSGLLNQNRKVKRAAS